MFWGCVLQWWPWMHTMDRWFLRSLQISSSWRVHNPGCPGWHVFGMIDIVEQFSLFVWFIYFYIFYICEFAFSFCGIYIQLYLYFLNVPLASTPSWFWDLRIGFEVLAQGGRVRVEPGDPQWAQVQEGQGWNLPAWWREVLGASFAHWEWLGKQQRRPQKHVSLCLDHDPGLSEAILDDPPWRQCSPFAWKEQSPMGRVCCQDSCVLSPEVHAWQQSLERDVFRGSQSPIWWFGLARVGRQTPNRGNQAKGLPWVAFVGPHGDWRAEGIVRFHQVSHGSWGFWRSSWCHASTKGIASFQCFSQIVKGHER